MENNIVAVITEYNIHLKSGGLVTLKYIGPPLFIWQNEEQESEEKILVRKLMALCETYGVPVIPI